ncbi:hypothetical protein ABFX02_01G059400 [Erythranthe guttata]
MGDSPPSLHRPPALSSPTAPPQYSPSGHHGRDVSLKIQTPMAVNKEEGNSQMIRGRKLKCRYTNHGRSRPYNHRICKGGKKSSSTNIESLPDELLFDILLHLPPRDIYDSAVFVCKKWRSVIRTRKFTCEHLRHSPPGLVIQSVNKREQTSFLTTRRGRIEISKFAHNDYKCLLWTSCNGLLLECDKENDYASYIANPSTSQRSPLPPKYYSGMAYAAASTTYKVVNWYHEYDNPEDRGCVILTVGVDKSWRLLHTQHLSLATRIIFNIRPLTTEGFVHWATTKSTHVLSLNVETEVIKEILVPKGYGEKLKYFLSTGTSLTFLTNIKEFSWEVWELSQETGEWTKMPSIDLEPQNFRSEYSKRIRNRSLMPPWGSNVTVKPVGWLSCREALVLHAFPTRLCIVYNVRTRGIDFFELNHDFDLYAFVVHRDSLDDFREC